MTPEQDALKNKLAEVWDEAYRFGVEDEREAEANSEWQGSLLVKHEPDRSNPFSDPTSAEIEEVLQHIAEARGEHVTAEFKRRIEASSLGTPHAKELRYSVSPITAAAVAAHAETIGRINALMDQKRGIEKASDPAVVEILSRMDEGPNEK